MSSHVVVPTLPPVSPVPNVTAGVSSKARAVPLPFVEDGTNVRKRPSKRVVDSDSFNVAPSMSTLSPLQVKSTDIKPKASTSNIVLCVPCTVDTNVRSTPSETLPVTTPPWLFRQKINVSDSGRESLLISIVHSLSSPVHVISLLLSVRETALLMLFEKLELSAPSKALETPWLITVLALIVLSSLAAVSACVIAS